jgi:ornithine cyclodeaminase
VTVPVLSPEVIEATVLCAWLGEQGLPARPASAHEAAGAGIVITTTPATSPVLNADAVKPGAHVTGIGTDMPHKNELPPELFRRAEMIATDDHAQCLHHGDFGRAVRAGAASEHSDTTAGAILQAPAPRSALAITVADLTGIGALDAAVASRLTRELLGRPAAAMASGLGGRRGTAGQCGRSGMGSRHRRTSAGK